jgi:mycothiol synthase
MNVSSATAYRLFDPAADYPAVAELVHETNVHDDEPWVPTAEALVHEWAPTSGYEAARDTLLAFDGERLVGAARVGWRERTGTVVHYMEIWVRPADRRRGIGSELLRWAEAHAIESVAAGEGGSPALPHVHSAETDRDNDAAMAFARAHGYAGIRFSFMMQRDLAEPIPDVPMPAGIDARPVAEAHHRRIWDADVEAFKDHWESAIREEADFLRFFNNPDLDTTLWQVGWAGDAVAGSVLACIYPDENRALGIQAGWLDHVSVRREWRGRGVASALIARALAGLRERGMAVARLGVDAENPTGALGVYERLGFHVERTSVKQRKPFPETVSG